MSFIYASFIKRNLLDGYANGSFTAEQVGIFALNYLLKGQIEQSDFDEIQGRMFPEPERENEQPQEQGSDK